MWLYLTASVSTHSMHVVTCGRVLADDVDIPDRFSKYTSHVAESSQTMWLYLTASVSTHSMHVVTCGRVLADDVDIPDRFSKCTHSMHVVTCCRVLADDVDIPDRFSKYTQYACSHMWPSPRRRCGYT
ncbi:hypothetical protein J6590_029470 [Homalodisca vitripennis]|nr:hypothetical protein J6590_029470 [Homalodisca vitripennis]